MAKSQVKGSKRAKKKPPTHRGNGGSIIGFTHQCRWWLCRDSRTKRNSAAWCSTQKCRSEPYRLTPTLSRSLAVASPPIIRRHRLRAQAMTAKRKRHESKAHKRGRQKQQVLFIEPSKFGPQFTPARYRLLTASEMKAPGFTRSAFFCARRLQPPMQIRPFRSGQCQALLPYGRPSEEWRCWRSRCRR